MLAQPVQMFVFDHECVAVLLKKKTNSRGSEGRIERQGVSDYEIEIEELDHFQRSPGFFPVAALVRRIQQIDQSALEQGDSYVPAGVEGFGHASAVIGTVADCRGQLHWHEVQIAKRERPCASTSEIVETAPDRVCLPKELQGRVVGDDRIRGQPGHDAVFAPMTRASWLEKRQEGCLFALFEVENLCSPIP